MNSLTRKSLAVLFDLVRQFVAVIRAPWLQQRVRAFFLIVRQQRYLAVEVLLVGWLFLKHQSVGFVLAFLFCNPHLLCARIRFYFFFSLSYPSL